MKEILIDSVVYVPKINEIKLGEYSIIRTYSAGVHFGILESREGREVVLKNSRRIWYWEGAFTLSALAIEGTSKPDKCRFSCVAPQITLTEAIEIIPCSQKATTIILGVPVWTPK